MASKVSASVTSARPRLSVVLVDPVVTQESVLPAATVSLQKPVASASYSAPAVVTTSVIPAAGIAYINMVFSADIDMSGLFSYKIDSVSMQDGRSFSFSKAPSESFIVVDGLAKTLSKPFDESVSFGDLIETTLIFLREFTETQDVSDSVLLSFAQALFETPSIVDAKAFSFEKYLSDGFAMNDSAEAGDGIQFSFSTSIQNIVFTSDAEQKNFQKTRTDSVGTADSGFILQQDYIDLTYFAEDYVGVGYTF
jgi:hypothetical protein